MVQMEQRGNDIGKLENKRRKSGGCADSVGRNEKTARVGPNPTNIVDGSSGGVALDLNEVIPNINMLAGIVMNCILQQINNTVIIVVDNWSRVGVDLSKRVRQPTEP